jgi:hypothetical protein
VSLIGLGDKAVCQQRKVTAGLFSTGKAPADAGDLTSFVEAMQNEE